MVGPQLGRETDAIAESAYKIKRRLCVTTLHVIRSAGKVVRPKPDRPDRRRRLWDVIPVACKRCQDACLDLTAGVGQRSLSSPAFQLQSCQCFPI